MTSRALVFLLVLAAAAALISLPWWMPSFYLTLTIRILFFSLLAMSFTFLAGQGGMVSLAQVAVFGTSAYVLAILSTQHGVAWSAAVPLALASGTTLAAVFGVFAVRTLGIYFLMITLALGQIVWGVAFQWVSMTGGFDGIGGLRAPTVLGVAFRSPESFYLLVLAATVLTGWLLHRIINSPFGLALNGVRDSPTRMQALGYPVSLIRYLAFVVAGLVASIAGVFFAYFTGVVNPSALDLFRSVWVLVVSILGGVGSLIGAVIGTTIVVLLQTVVSQITPRYMTIIGLVFLLTILFAPDGITGRFHALRKRLKRERPSGGPTIDDRGPVEREV
ncbi:MAG: branched-chain amino acid ABC transporter permease [Trueperaceae bacterium]|nr:MAG: branched-chain amino acid ABC transporter permease [Trueperaceae bacterium]